jgi:hypothetical protein
LIAKVYQRGAEFGSAFLPLKGEGGFPPTFTTTWNLPTDDVPTAEVIMSAFARQNTRIQFPVYRFRIFFDPSDELDEEKQKLIATTVLSDLGCDQFQAVVGGFAKGESRYLYVVVNRVHPETRVPWRRFKDMLTIMQSLRYLERKCGLREVPMPGRTARGGERFPGGFRGPPDQVVRSTRPERR